MMVHISFYEFWLVFYKAGSGSLKMKRIRIRNTELMIGYSECGGGAAGVLADEGGPRHLPQERGASHIRERSLLRHYVIFIKIDRIPGSILRT